MAEKMPKTHHFTYFFQKKRLFSCIIQKKVVPLHPQMRNKTEEWSSW